ncbi:Protein TolB [Neochlamydia sp. TUME1]|uniref:Tol-Pal system protein TolB n=1 Tax=Neochlamydia sp. TUME1 TaxID=1478174 RepID=UPI00057CEAF0|nr:Tol-Pal system protein TolB [Neochlamydia sp. TUME1]KIC72274.1 Protein TolB [Neochlamydia sp. TUME1]
MTHLKYYFIILFLFLVFKQNLSALANEDNEKIVVRLATESKLMPLYLAPFYQENPAFTAHYIQQLEQVLQFDLNHNGMTFTLKNESKAPVGNFLDAVNSSSWKSLNVYYVLKILIKDNQMSARMLSMSSDHEKSVNNIPLSGDLSQDRRQIHRLADSLHKSLFGSEGIASTRIIYTCKTSHGLKSIAEVWEADYDGANARQITHENSLIVTPTYIPPQQGHASGSIMYVSYRAGQSKIYIASLKDGVGRRFSLLKGNQLMPAIAKQRDKVAFICDYTGNPDLFLQTFDPEKGAIGKPQQIFSTYLATQGTPTFSPDGSKIAFVSNKDGSPRIYVIDIPAPGASLKNIKALLISKSNRENTAPAWSPDGSKLAYCAKSQDTRQIWIYDFDKKQERQITKGGGHKENPTWAPNSLHLVFNSAGNNSSELYLINLHQPEAVKISSGEGLKRFPAWEPKFSK